MAGGECRLYSRAEASLVADCVTPVHLGWREYSLGGHLGQLGWRLGRTCSRIALCTRDAAACQATRWREAERLMCGAMGAKRGGRDPGSLQLLRIDGERQASFAIPLRSRVHLAEMAVAPQPQEPGQPGADGGATAPASPVASQYRAFDLWLLIPWLVNSRVRLSRTCRHWRVSLTTFGGFAFRRHRVSKRYELECRPF